MALELAKGLTVPLLVLHVVSSISGPASWRETLAAHERILLARARSKMDTFVAPLGTESQIETLVTTGSPADEIGAIAAEHHVGLIVMGLVGTSGPLGTARHRGVPCSVSRHGPCACAPVEDRCVNLNHIQPVEWTGFPGRADVEMEPRQLQSCPLIPKSGYRAHCNHARHRGEVRTKIVLARLS